MYETENYKPFKNPRLNFWKQTGPKSLVLRPGQAVDLSFNRCRRTAINIQSWVSFQKMDEDSEFLTKLKKFTKPTFSKE